MHPAAEWAKYQTFSHIEIDCTTAVVLKILDGKCKMLPGEKSAILAIYDVVNPGRSDMFDPVDLQTIQRARNGSGYIVKEQIHELRIYAEAVIPKAVMKKYKARLREGLFGD